MPRPPRAVLTAIVLLGFLVIVHGLAVPAYRLPDEPLHLDYARASVDELGHPGFERRLAGDIAADLGTVRFGDRSRALTAAEAPPRDGRPLHDGDLPPGGVNQLVQHPPLYYLAIGVVDAAAEVVVPGYDDWPLTSRLGLLRLVQVIFVLPLPLLAWLTTRRLGLGDHAGIAAAVGLTLIPQFAHNASGLNNDNLLNLFIGIGTYLAVRIATGDSGPRTAFAVGAVTGLALLTKAFGAVLAPTVGLAYLVAVIHRHIPWRTGALRVAQSGLAATVLAGPWLVYAWNQTGNLQPRIPLVPEAQGFDPSVTVWFRGFTHRVVTRVWGDFGWFDVQINRTLAGVLTLVLMAVVAIGLWGRSRPERLDRLVVGLPIGLLGLTLMYASWSSHARTSVYPAIHGRYVFGAIVGIAVLVAAGLGTVLRRDRAVAPVLLASGAAMQVLAFSVLLGFYWGPSGAGPLTRIDALLAWSPWAEVVTLGAFAALALSAVVLAVQIATQITTGGDAIGAPSAPAAPLPALAGDPTAEPTESPQQAHAP